MPRVLALLALTLLACGKGEVFGLGPPGVETDTGVFAPDAQEDAPDSGELPLKDAGDSTDSSSTDPDAAPDSSTSDAGFDRDAQDLDAQDRDAQDLDAQTPDAGLDAGGNPDAMVPDGGPECLTDTDCGFGGFFGRCDPATLTCVECYLDQHCGGQQVCDTNNGNVCRFPCFMGGCGPLGVCDPSGQFCVECAQDTDCNQGEVCDTSVFQCVECTVDADCALTPGMNLCDPSNGTCVGCVSDADCPGGECIPQGVCATPTGRGLCVPCNDDAQCGNGTTDLCIGYVGAGGLFDRACAIDCANTPTVCPNGFECISVRMGAMQCRPRYDMQTPTCTATRHLGEACFPDPMDLDPGCGIEAVQDARCEPNANGTGICVVWCQDNTDCANGTTCQGSSTGMQMVCR